MPIYEYACRACNGRFQKLVRGFSTPPDLACPRCQSHDLHRIISRFATLKSEDARMETLADPASFAALDENDPRAIAAWARRMGKELGDDAGEDWDEMVDQMLEEELGNDDSDDSPAAGASSSGYDNLGWG